MIERQRNYFHKYIRLQNYDYSQPGAYFITICTHKRECLFGKIIETNGIRNLVLNRFGKIIRDEWLRTPAIRHEILLDEFIVMPNHFHAIIIITNDVGAYGHTPLQTQIRTFLQSYTPLQPTTLRSPSKTVGALVRGFKSTITRDINQMRHTPYAPIWQRNYYEHVIRNDEELNRIREYIQYNPTQWELDRENPERNGISAIEKEIWG
jgi:REP element-mobilizing transposase RayT